MVNLYVDVDGVLNAVSWLAPDWDWPDTQLSEVDGYPIRWSAAMVGRLNRLAARPGVTAYWLTTWGRRAAEILSPALGVEGGAWPVLGDVERERAVDTIGQGGSGWWKHDAIRAHLPPGTPAVWIDDDLRRDPDALAWAVDAGVLAVAPATEFALTPQHFERIEAYVEQREPG